MRKSFSAIFILLTIAGSLLVWDRYDTAGLGQGNEEEGEVLGAVTPELPRAYVDTAMPTQTGQTRTVNTASNCNSSTDGLQAQINAANLGDTIIIPAGAVCAGKYTLPNKTSGSGWIVIKSSMADQLPQGVRVKPSDAPKMAKIMTNSVGTAPLGETVFSTANGAHHYRLIGLEITQNPTVRLSYSLIYLSTSSYTPENLPHHIILDRMYIHGSRALPTQVGVKFEGMNLAVINSHIGDIHWVRTDAQTINGSNGPGPYKIVNNFLEASGENTMFGGCGSSAGECSSVSEAMMPADIEFRGNYYYKPLSWRYRRGTSLPASCMSGAEDNGWGERYELVAGGGTTAFYQCKSGAWATAGMSPIHTYRSGTSLPATCKVDSGTDGWGEHFRLLNGTDISASTWYQCKDSIWVDRNTSYGDPSDYWMIKNLFELKNAQRVLVEGNVMKNTWPYGQDEAIILNGVDGDFSTIENVTFRNNIILNSPRAIVASANGLSQLQLRPTNTILFDNNFFSLYREASASLSGSLYQGSVGIDRVGFNHNTMVLNNLVGTTGNLMFLGSGAGVAKTDTFMMSNNITPSSGMIGDSHSTSEATLNYYLTDITFRKNAMVGFDPAKFPSYQENFSLSSPNDAGFANPGAGDYRLAATSPYKNQGTDGKDIGVDWVQLNTVTAGVVEGTWAENASIPSDTMPPAPMNVSATNITANSATITWTTNEPADSQVEYGASLSYGSLSSLDSTRVTGHSLTISGLSAGTAYHYRAKSGDAAGNIGTSSDFTFTTQSSIQNPGSGNLFTETFSGALSASVWTKVDEGTTDGPSQWSVAGGQLQQMSNLYATPADAANIAKRGTYQVAGSASWSDYSVAVKLMSSDDDDIGLMFRVKDSNNYYRFSMSRQYNYQRFVKVVNGNASLIKENVFTYSQGQWYSLKIDVQGSSIKVYVDGNLAMDVTDASISSGRIALYDWANAGSYFDNVFVSSIGGSSAPIPGDLNNDRIVNSLDYSLLNGRWNQSYAAYDLNGDSFINSLDFAIMKNNWGRTG